MEYLAFLAQPAMFVGTCLVAGLAVGSFLNVVIHRLPIMMDREWRAQCAELRGDPVPQEEPFGLALPRSRCPNCGHGITAAENVPVLSYLLLRGRCRACKARISPRYPLVEILCGLLFASAAVHFGFGPAAVAAMLYLAALIALTGIDFDKQLLPDDITLPLMWAGLLVNMFGTFTDLRSAVIGAAAGYLSLWSVYWGFKLATGKEGMGYGDFKLLAALGAWLGWQALPALILLSSVIGAVIGIGAMVSGLTKRGEPIPFGPFLAAAGIVAMFFDDTIAGLFRSGARL